ncbi:MAG: cell division protein FtsL [Devosia sp.]
MIRNINIILIFISVFMLAGVYTIKFGIENTADKRTALIAEIDSQEGQLSLLQADEAVLNQPGHIEPIIKRHAIALDIEPVRQEQFGAFGDLPMRPVKPNTAEMNSLFTALEAGVDPIDAILELEGIQ